MNGYWKRNEVTVSEALYLARKLWELCDSDIGEHDRYWRQGGNAKMPLRDKQGAYVYVYFSPWLHRSGVTVERQGLKESMTYSPRMTLLEIDSGWFSGYGAWRYDPSNRDENLDLQRECHAALESYRRSTMGVREIKEDE